MSAREGTVLYDALGPRARRRVLLSSIVALVLLLAVVYAVYVRLEAQNQFASEKWAPLFKPGDASFSPVWKLLWQGLQATLKAAGLAMVLSLLIGTLLAVSRITAARWYRWAIVGVVELFRGIPVVIAIFFASRVLPELGVDLSTMWFLVIGLTAYNSVVIAEIVRAGVAAVPSGQREASYAIGLTGGQTLRLVLLPQAFRIMLPALISQLVVVLKDTSLGAFISYQELVRTGQLIVQNLSNPIQTYLLIGAIFIAVNYVLSKLAVLVERRLSRQRKTADPTGTAPLLTAEIAGASSGTASV